MRKHKRQHGERVPRPSALDKDDVEDVGLARKVARFDAAAFGRMCLRYRIVGGGARVGRDEGEDGAKDEEDWEETEGYALERRGEEWRRSRW